MQERKTANYSREDIYDTEKIEKLSHHYAEIMKLLGEDIEREGLIKSPERIAKAMSFITKGYAEDAVALLRSALFTNEGESRCTFADREMILVKDIEFYSLCEHHMLPFYGKAHVAYIPSKKITGLSKIARVVECFARRMQVQERLTYQIHDALHEALAPRGVAVIVEGSHMCMQMRGVQNPAVTRTSAFSGLFSASEKGVNTLPYRQEFLAAIDHK